MGPKLSFLKPSERIKKFIKGRNRLGSLLQQVSDLERSCDLPEGYYVIEMRWEPSRAEVEILDESRSHTSITFNPSLPAASI